MWDIKNGPLSKILVLNEKSTKHLFSLIFKEVFQMFCASEEGVYLALSDFIRVMSSIKTLFNNVFPS